MCADVHAGLSWRLMAVEVELTRIHQGNGVEPRLDLRKGRYAERRNRRTHQARPQQKMFRTGLGLDI